MNRIVPTLLALADHLASIRMFDVAGGATQTVAAQAEPSHMTSFKQHRPDIAEAIARGEYALMQRTGRSADFSRRSIQLRFQKLS